MASNRIVGDTSSVTRFEVVDHRLQPVGEPVTGRAFVAHPCRVELSYQDGGRTLKVFVDDSFREDTARGQ